MKKKRKETKLLVFEIRKMKREKERKREKTVC